MPITSNNPVGPVDSLAALKALMRGNTGVMAPSLNASDPGGYVQNAANADSRLTEMKHNIANEGPNFASGANSADVEGLQQDIHDDPFTGAAAHKHVADEEALNSALQQYSRPDVTAQRKDVQADALQKLLLPIQMKGQYDVEAAKQSQIGANGRQDRAIEGTAALQGQRDDAMALRAAANAGSITARQRLQALQTGKAHAARPGGIMDSLFGPSQSSLDQKEIAGLMASGGGQDDNGLVSMHAPDGRPLKVPSHKVNEMEAAGAVRD